jgi:thymidine kinase
VKKKAHPPKIDAIIVDEAQFLSREDIDELSDMVDKYNIPVMCYGLRTDFQGNAFPGSARLLELADEIVESSTVCWCGRKARFNARVCDGKIVREGEQVQLGGNESYTSLCRKHFKEGIVEKPSKRERNKKSG